VTWFWLSALFAPLLAFAVDWVGQVRAGVERLREGHARASSLVPVDGTLSEADFTLVVPIYGNMSYLENAEWLAQHGSRVLLATSGSESDAFYRDLNGVAERYGFRVFVGGPALSGRPGQRSTSGTKRDTIVRDAHQVIDTEYVVCIDADTMTEKPVETLVGAFARSGLDLGSVPLTVANKQSILGRLQALEYAMAMRLRRVMPWMVCGGCHIARREVHARLMAQHSLFFQGNDVELGLLAVEQGLRVGHLDFSVPTVVPDTVRGWWRQRVAWIGGEFRITVVNIRLARHHPFLWIYGLVIVLLLAPLRWLSLDSAGWVLLAVYVCYVLAVVSVTGSVREPLLLVYPLYALLYTMVLLPFGGFSYANQAIKSRNAGLIGRRVRRGANGPTVQASSIAEHAA
jgi:hypothetical protein